MIKFEMKTKIYPTEDEKIIYGIFKKFYPFKNFEISDKDDNGIMELYAKTQGFQPLKFIYEQVRNQKIVETVRNYIRNRINFQDGICTFMLNKQTLTNNMISLCFDPKDVPLGPIYIKIQAEKIGKVMEYLFPPTKDGKVIEPGYELDELI